MQRSDLPLTTALLHGADLTGLCMLTALLALSAWVCLRPQLAVRGARPPAGQTSGLYLLLCAMAAPLLMFAGIAALPGMLEKAQPILTASAQWSAYRTMLWLLYGVIGLQQLFALQRLAFSPSPRIRRLMPLASTALVLLPLAAASGLLALDRLYLGQAGLSRGLVAAAALASISSLLLWLPMQAMASRAQAGPRAEPSLSAPLPATPDSKAEAAVPTIEGDGGQLSSAAEMERHLNELSALLEQEQRRAEQDSQRELLQQEEALNESTIQQQVREQ